MSKMIIVEGNSNDKDNTRVFMVKGEKGDTGDVSIEELNAEISARTNADNNLQSQINGLASGSPLVASSVSGMTDTSKVYVNTTDGNWYYYNGSEWVIGGVYQAVISSDDDRTAYYGVLYNSLGESIRNQSKQLPNILKYICGMEEIPTTQNGNITCAGSKGSTITINPSAYNDWEYALIDVNEGDRFLLNCKGGSNPRAYCFVDENNVILDVAGAGNTFSNALKIAPKNAKKLIINNNKSYAYRSYKYNANSFESNIFDIEHLEGTINSNNNASIIKLNRDFAIDCGGSVGQTVTPVFNINYDYESIMLEVNALDEYCINAVGGSNPRAYCVLDEDLKILSISGAGVDLTNKIITMPINSKYLIINNRYKAKKAYSYKKIPTDIQTENKLEYSINPANYTSSINDFYACVNGSHIANKLNNPEKIFKDTVEKMNHVATSKIINDVVYMSYYTNKITGDEDPTKHTARFAISPLNSDTITYYDICSIGDQVNGMTVNKIYDVVLMTIDNENIYIMWTAQLSDGEYYRLYKVYNITSGQFGNIETNNFVVNGTTYTFNTTGLNTGLNEANISHKIISSNDDIGIMQKLSSYVENGVTYYYSSCYVLNFNCVIRTTDLINWEFITLPTFDNSAKWECATFIKDSYLYYYMRQNDHYNYGILARFNLITKLWDTNTVRLNDCQSRGDFFEFNNNLYLIHAPLSRNNLEIVRIDTTNINRSYPVASIYSQSKFYPFVELYNNELYLSTTYSRQAIYFTKFNLETLTCNEIVNKLITNYN